MYFILELVLYKRQGHSIQIEHTPLNRVMDLVKKFTVSGRSPDPISPPNFDIMNMTCSIPLDQD